MSDPITQINIGTSSNPDVRDFHDSRVGLATSQAVGMVKPDGTTTTVDNDGTLHASTFSVDTSGYIIYG